MNNILNKYSSTEEQQYLVNIGVLKRNYIKEIEEAKHYQELADKNLPLPEGVYYFYDTPNNNFFNLSNFYTLERVIDEEKTNDTILLLIASTLKDQRKDIETIKKCVIFFTVIAVISLIAAIAFS